MSSNNRQMIFYLLVTYASKLSVSTLHTQVYQNSIIATGIFSVSFNSDWLQCIKNCMDSEDCVSYNFEVSGIDSLCELSRCGLPITTGCTKKALRFANGFVYQQLKIPMKNWAECNQTTVLPSTSPPTPPPYKDCLGVYNDGEITSKVYSIDPDGRGKFPVQCDQSTLGGGWIIIQQRNNGLQDFYQPWDSYVNGFGRLDGEFWLGLDKIHRLTLAGNTDLLIEMTDANAEHSGSVMYENFTVSSREALYKLDVSYKKGYGASDSLTTLHAGCAFSAKDKDNDLCNCSCAQKNKGAWWYYGRNDACSTSDLNALYDSITWSTYGYKIAKTYMKIRPHRQLK